MENKYIRKCPNNNCNNIITYNQLNDKKKADNKNSICNSCRFNINKDRDNSIINLLTNTELNHKEIAKQLNITHCIIKHVRKKYNIKREPKLSKACIELRRENFINNVLNKGLNKFGGVDKLTYEKIFKTRFGYSYSDFLAKQTEFKKYYNEVRNITLKNLRKYKNLFENLDNLGRCGDIGKFQVDHNFSIKRGFEMNITPHLIGHPSNLRVISWEENLKKTNNCNITLDELINNSAIFLTKNNKILINYDF